MAADVGTPTYVYSRGTLAEHLRRVREAFAAVDPLICYSVKSCGNLAVLRTLVDLGAGMDVVSGGELHRALAAGCPPERIVYAGVGKRDDEIAAALDAGIHLLNVESEQDFENIARIAHARGTRCRCALRIN
ncbi:MAG: diaminopimelate decarboxylase, partial [Phycisphaerales bacterium]